MVARLIAFFLLLPSFAVQAAIDNAIRSRLENGQKTELQVAGATVMALPSLRRFYETRGFQPAWTGDGGNPTAEATKLLVEIRRSREEGLNPDDYHLPSLERLIGKPSTMGRQVDLELLFSDAWLVLASHYLSGRIDPLTIDAEWVPSRRHGNLPERLELALDSRRTVEALHSLLPSAPGYARLRELLAQYRAKSGRPPIIIPAGPSIRPDTSDPRVPALRYRLELPEIQGPSQWLYDDRLSAAVKVYQQAHGLEADGIVGPSTLDQLNAAPEKRIDQILANLERWRWMPADMGHRHVLVNIANFRLEAWEGGALLQSMKVIVGRTYRRTPLFSDKIRYLVINPSWEVPPAIAVKDKLPELRKDPAKLQRAGFVVLHGTGADEVELDPREVDWMEVNRTNFPYRLRQKPGPANALGRVKIMFPNRFNVYLHDTPNPELFTKNVRTFSSGCIRLEDPLGLSLWLLAGNRDWPRERLDEAIASGQTQTLLLQEPVPVHLQYWTVWVDDDGKPHFIEDVYQRDAPLVAALGSGIRQ